MRKYTLRELQQLETLSQGHTDDLKIKTEDTKVWLSRMTVEDGMPANNMVTIEKLIDGRWVKVEEYPAVENGLQIFTLVYSWKERKDVMKNKYDCYEFDIEEAFGLSYVFVSPDWERFLNSFTDDYEKYPPRIAPHPGLNKLGLYYFDKDIAVLVTPAGIYSHGAASLTLRGPAYRPLSKYFETWGE